MIEPEHLRFSLADRLFGKNVVQNNLRSEVVEEVLTYVLDNRWHHSAGDWNSWDFEHINGCKLEVKQSAARQTWGIKQGAKPSFDIAFRKGFWKGDVWYEHKHSKRNSDIYVFAWHSVIDDVCNHFDAWQWIFFVILEKDLPRQKTIRLSKIEKLTEGVGVDEVAARIEYAKTSLTS